MQRTSQLCQPVNQMSLMESIVKYCYFLQNGSVHVTQAALDWMGNNSRGKGGVIMHIASLLGTTYCMLLGKNIT